MTLSIQEHKRDKAQERVWDAVDAFEACDEAKAIEACLDALDIYPDCVDAMVMLADSENLRTCDYVEKMRAAVEAGRRDLGESFFREHKGQFWGLLETRPFMRAMANLAMTLRDWGTRERVDEGIAVFEEMLELNPNDNQGIRDTLASLLIAHKRYADARALFARYEDDFLVTRSWSEVLLAFISDGPELAGARLVEAKKRNERVEEYLSGRKRRPRHLPAMYSIGSEEEAVFCAHVLWPAWKAHPKAKKWLKEACMPAESRSG